MQLIWNLLKNKNMHNFWDRDYELSTCDGKNSQIKTNIITCKKQLSQKHQKHNISLHHYINTSLLLLLLLLSCFALSSFDSFNFFNTCSCSIWDANNQFFSVKIVRFDIASKYSFCLTQRHISWPPNQKIYSFLCFVVLKTFQCVCWVALPPFPTQACADVKVCIFLQIILLESHCHFQPLMRPNHHQSKRHLG